MQPSDFRADINGLRGLSVALVVAYHLQLRGAGGGFVGVDVFFVVSGYLMTLILLRQEGGTRARYAAFVAARARRIGPALAALAGALLVGGAIGLPPFDLESLARQALWALAFVSNHFYLAHSGYTDRRSDDLWLLHSWSLSVEWQFYLLYPLLVFALLAACRRWRPDAPPALPRRVLWCVLVGLAAASLAWQVQQRGAVLERGFFLFPARAWELLAGGLVYLLATERTSAGARVRRWSTYAGVAAILVSALALAALRWRPAGLDLALLGPVLGAGLVLWAGDTANPWLRPAWLQALGRWSYSIYLWHWPILVALRLTPWWLEYRMAAIAAALLLSLLAGALSYRWIERPFLSRGPGTHRSLWPAWRGPGIALALAAVLAGVAYATDGLAARDRAEATAWAGYEASVGPLLFPDRRCSNFRKPVEAMVLCPIERGNGRRLLVIGDSHAEHLWPWFVKHSRVSVDFFPASECPPVPRFERLQPGFRCMDYAARAWELARAPAYDTLVVSARWATVGLAGPPYCHEATPGRCEAPSAARKPSLVLDELRGAIEASLRAGKNVVVLDSAPEAPVRVPRRIARERFWHGEPRLAIERRAVTEANAWVDALFDELGKRPRFYRVSLRDTLCDALRCRVYDDTLGRPVYIDDSHFDPVWIAENARFFEPFVQREPPALPLNK